MSANELRARGREFAGSAVGFGATVEPPSRKDQIATPARVPRGRGRPVGADSGRTRRLLLETAHQVMAERGFADATIREIAERANVNAALVHYYFGTKAGVRRAVIERVHTRLRDELASLDRRGDALTRLRALVCGYLRIVARERHLARMVLHELVADPECADPLRSEIGDLMAGEIEALLLEGERRGDFRRLDLPKPLTPVLANVLLYGLVAPWIEASAKPPCEAELEQFACLATELLLHGVARH